jgi:hypothetical protein
VIADAGFGLELFVDDHDRYVFLWLLGELAERSRSAASPTA